MSISHERRARILALFCAEHWKVRTIASEQASSELALCGWDDAAPRGFATARVADAPFESDGMLPTVQESLGRCEFDLDRLRDGLPAHAYRPSFDLSVEANEIVMEAAPGGERHCLPLREALCALGTPPSGCSH